MRVLFVTCWYPSAARPGFGVFVKEHAAAVNYVGNQVALLAIIPSAGPGLMKTKLEHFTDENGVKTWVLHLSGSLHNIVYNNPWYLNYQAELAFKQIIESGFVPEVLHAQVIYPAGVITRNLSQKFNLPYIITEHWSKVAHFMKRSFFGKMGLKAYADAAAITTVSQFLAHEIAPFVPNPDEIKVVPNVVDSDLFHFKAKKPGDKIEMLAIMNLVLPKRPDLLIKAVALAQKIAGKPIRLSIIGQGPLFAEMESLAKNLGTELVLLGKQPKADLPTFFHTSDFFLHASDYETFGIVVAEALSTGTPVLVSNLPALHEMLTEGEGLFADNNLHSWAEIMGKAITRPWPNAEIAQRNSYLYGPKLVGQQFTDLYKKAVGR